VRGVASDSSRVRFFPGEESSYEIASIWRFRVLVDSGTESLADALDLLLFLAGVLKVIGSYSLSFLNPHLPFFPLTALRSFGPPVASSTGVLDSNKAGVLS